MHLTMLALRIIAIKAISGNTWVGDAVFDSPSSIEDMKIEGDRGSFINVYVDEADINAPDDPGINTPGAERIVRLILEVGVASKFKVKDGTDEIKGIELQASNAGFEAQITMVSRQAVDALQAVGDGAPWSELWRKLTAAGVARTEIRRGGQQDDRQKNTPRYAAQVTIIHAAPLAEPYRGADLAKDFPVWQQVLTAISADPDYGEIGKLMTWHITGAAPLPTEAAKAAAFMQMSAAATDMIGLGERAFPKVKVRNAFDPGEEVSEDVPVRDTVEPATSWPDGYPAGEYEPDVQ